MTIINGIEMDDGVDEPNDDRIRPVWNPWLTCLDCGFAQFVPDPDDQADAESNPIRCPKCKSMKLTWNSTICAWCAKVHNITVPPGQSHGICARHQAEVEKQNREL